MNLISRYIRYLKNNPEHYWFKRKPFGWGWTPATWEGWVILLLFLAFIVGSAGDFVRVTPPDAQAACEFALQVTASVVALLFICSITGEEPHWQWGFPKE
jgi:hypothetical protein